MVRTVMNSFVVPNSAWSIVRIKYVCEPNFFDVVFVHVMCLWYHSLRILSPSPLLQIKIETQDFGGTIGVRSQAKKKNMCWKHLFTWGRKAKLF